MSFRVDTETVTVNELELYTNINMGYYTLGQIDNLLIRKNSNYELQLQMEERERIKKILVDAIIDDDVNKIKDIDNVHNIKIHVINDNIFNYVPSSTHVNALEYAIVYDSREACKYLASIGMKPCTTLNINKSCLMYAVENRNIDMVKYLLKHCGANPNYINKGELLAKERARLFKEASPPELADKWNLDLYRITVYDYTTSDEIRILLSEYKYDDVDITESDEYKSVINMNKQKILSSYSPYTQQEPTVIEYRNINGDIHYEDMPDVYNVDGVLFVAYQNMLVIPTLTIDDMNAIATNTAIIHIRGVILVPSSYTDVYNHHVYINMNML